MKTTIRSSLGRRGFTAVELLVSTTVFLLAITAILTALVCFLRAHQSYTQTAYFSSRVRLNQERMMQELRNTSTLVAGTANDVTVKMVDLQGSEWTVRYYPQNTSNGISLMRTATRTGSTTPAVSEVFSGLRTYQFTYFDRRGANPTSTPSTPTAIKALRLDLTPLPRHQLLFGRDEATVRDAGNAAVNTVIHFRNS